MLNDKKILTVIPARMGGYRFPDKPLRKLLGKPMIQWVFEHAKQSRFTDKVVIATPNLEIKHAAEAFGAEVVLTSGEHRRGTERVYEAYCNLGSEFDIIVNFQGDEPLVTGEVLDLAIQELYSNSDVSAVNLFKWMSYDEAEKDQNEVKVVVDVYGNAMYFSRNVLPAKWLGDKQFQSRAEICVMPMYAHALEKFVNLENAYYEEIESVDMMRFVENGYKVRMLECTSPVKSVDCESDLIEAESLLKQFHV